MIILILLIGALLRFTNLNWDSYQAFHPDERNIAWAVTRIHWFDELNPKFSPTGSPSTFIKSFLTVGTATSLDDRVG